jgi:hypothetical protein
LLAFKSGGYYASRFSEENCLSHPLFKTGKIALAGFQKLWVQL